MKRSTKIWLIVAASLVLAGALAFVGVMIMLNWNFNLLSTDKHQTNVHEISDGYENVLIQTDTADVAFVPSADGKTTVTCEEKAGLIHTVEVKDGTLRIVLNDTRKWYEYIGINLGGTKVTVALPGESYGALTVACVTGNVTLPSDLAFSSIDVKGGTGNVTCAARVQGKMQIKLSTGDISVERSAVGAMDLSVTTGKIALSSVTIREGVAIGVSTGKAILTDVACATLTSSGDTGAIALKNVIATDSISIERSTGDVSFEGCDGGEIRVKTSTGDVAGTLLSEKVFITKTSTGKVQVPSSASGGKCEISTSTGDIKISIS